MKSRSPLTGTKHTPAEYEAAKAEPVELHQQVSADWKAPHFVWQVRRRARPDVLPGHAQRLPRGRHRRLQGHHHASTGTCRRPPRSGSTSRPARTHAKDPLAILSSRKIAEADRSLDPRPARPQHQQRRRRGHRLPDRRGPRLRRVGQLHVQGQQEVPAPVRRPRRRLAAARVGDQADRLRDRHRRQDPDRLDDDHGRRPRTSAAASSRPRPTSSSAARSAFARRSSSRSTSRPSRPRSCRASTTPTTGPRTSG